MSWGVVFIFCLPHLSHPCQVLEVVRSNYDTLTLKLQDGLDQFERYSEQPKEAAFFKELVRASVTLYKVTLTAVEDDL